MKPIPEIAPKWRGSIFSTRSISAIAPLRSFVMKRAVDRHDLVEEFEGERQVFPLDGRGSSLHQKIGRIRAGAQPDALDRAGNPLAFIGIGRGCQALEQFIEHFGALSGFSNHRPRLEFLVGGFGRLGLRLGFPRSAPRRLAARACGTQGLGIDRSVWAENARAGGKLNRRQARHAQSVARSRQWQARRGLALRPHGGRRAQQRERKAEHEGTGTAHGQENRVPCHPGQNVAQAPASLRCADETRKAALALARLEALLLLVDYINAALAPH